MAGGKETPRQKMIGILYLVLLGLVALNVSDSILDAFKNLTESLSTSTQNVQSGVDATFKSFEATKLKSDPLRARPIYEKANKARSYLADLEGYLGELKTELEKQGGGLNESTGDLKKRDNLDISARYMINQGHAKELRKKIEETREKLLALLNESQRKGVKFSLSTSNPSSYGGVSKTWEEANFGDGIPLTAAITALTKIQADVKNAESEMVRLILGEMDQTELNLDRFDVVAVAPTSYVIQGQPYQAEVFLTASSSTLKQTINVGGGSLPINSDGRGLYTVNTYKEGEFTWSATLTMTGTDGKPKIYKTDPQKYTVARPSAVVSPDKMNVFYAGVPNPVSISAPGISNSKLKVSISNGSISGADGKYTVNVNSLGQTTVTVSAELNGRLQTISSTNFRVKRVPDPLAKFAGKTGERLSSAIIKSQDRIFAILEGFDFDARFRITGFRLSIIDKGNLIGPLQSNSNMISGNLKSALASVRPGSLVVFDNITAVGPDGTQRLLNSITITAN